MPNGRQRDKAKIWLETLSSDHASIQAMGLTEFDEFLTDMSITNPAMLLNGKTVAELQARDPEKYSYHATAVYLAKQVAQ